LLREGAKSAEGRVKESAVRTIYRYGPIKWIWRAMIAGGQVGGWLLVVFGIVQVEFWAYLVAAPLILPGVFFGHVVATQVDLLDYGELVVTTLLGGRRRLTREELGRPRLFFYAQTTDSYVYAPRAWIPVRRKWPIYLDLYGEIADRKTFIAMFGIEKRHVPGW
jgi:hypothetical protein